MSRPTHSLWRAASRGRSRAGRRNSALASRRRKPPKGRNSMCGIVGIAGREDAAPLILEALRRLEYRGYDSAGIATLAGGHIERRRAPGKLNKLASTLAKHPLEGRT